MGRTEGGGYLARPRPSGLADVLEIVLDKGVVIDAYARVSLIGIEVLTIDARIVVSSVDTYLRFAEATNRLDPEEHGETLLDLLERGTEAGVEKAATGVADHKVEGALDKVEGALGPTAKELTRKTAGKLVDVAERLAGDT